jgi:acetoin utilization protein AcuB
MLVKNYMTHNPAYMSPDDDVRVAFNILSDRRIRQAPVMENNKLVGIITDRDLRMALVQHVTEPNLTVGNIMTPDPVAVSEDLSLEEAGQILTSHKFNATPVLSEDGKLTGIITTTDILRGILHIVEIPKTKGPLMSK